MPVRTKTKRKPAKRASSGRKAKPKPAASAPNRPPAPAPAPVQRRKLVHDRTGEVVCDAAGNVVTWAGDDPEAVAVLMAKARSGIGWCLVPVEYRFASLGAMGKVWR
jgi:hypothetical protein